MTEVPLSVDSLNSGDVFILDLGPKIIVWAGSAATGREKNKALTYTIALRDDRDHKGTAQVREIYHHAKLSPDDNKSMTLSLPSVVAETITVWVDHRQIEAVCETGDEGYQQGPPSCQRHFASGHALLLGLVRESYCGRVAPAGCAPRGR